MKTYNFHVLETNDLHVKVLVYRNKKYVGFSYVMFSWYPEKKYFLPCGVEEGEGNIGFSTKERFAQKQTAKKHLKKLGIPVEPATK